MAARVLKQSVQLCETGSWTRVCFSSLGMTQAHHRFWILAYPDLPKPVGGIKQMHRVGEAIQASGHEVVLVQGDPAFHPGWFQSALPTTDFMSWIKRTDLVQELDVIILAETFLPSLSSLKPGIPKILFNQNGVYTLGLLVSNFLCLLMFFRYINTQI